MYCSISWAEVYQLSCRFWGTWVRMSKLLNSSGSTEEPRIQLGYSSEPTAPLDTFLGGFFHGNPETKIWDTMRD